MKQASAPVAVVATSPAFSSQPSSTESTQKKEKTGIFGKLKSKLGVGKTAEEEFERPLSAGDYQRPHTAASGSKASSKSTSKTAESKYDQDVFEDVPFESDNEEAVKVTVIQPASPKTNSKASKKQAKTAVSNLAKSHVAGDNASSSSLVINKGAVNPKIELTAPQSESQADAKAGAIPEPSSLAVVGKTDSKRGSGLLGGLFRRSKSSSQQSINKAASSQNLQKKEAEDAKNQETANAVMQAIFSAPVSATSATPSVAASVTPTSAATTDSQNQLNGGRKHVTFGGSSEDKLADAAYIASTSSK